MTECTLLTRTGEVTEDVSAPKERRKAIYRTRMSVGLAGYYGEGGDVFVEVDSIDNPACFSQFGEPVDVLSHDDLVQHAGLGEITSIWLSRGLNAEQIRTIEYYHVVGSADLEGLTQHFELPEHLLWDGDGIYAAGLANAASVSPRRHS